MVDIKASAQVMAEQAATIFKYDATPINNPTELHAKLINLRTCWQCHGGLCCNKVADQLAAVLAHHLIHELQSRELLTASGKLVIRLLHPSVVSSPGLSAMASSSNPPPWERLASEGLLAGQISKSPESFTLLRVSVFGCSIQLPEVPVGVGAGEFSGSRFICTLNQAVLQALSVCGAARSLSVQLLIKNLGSMDLQEACFLAVSETAPSKLPRKAKDINEINPVKLPFGLVMPPKTAPRRNNKRKVAAADDTDGDSDHQPLGKVGKVDKAKQKKRQKRVSKNKDKDMSESESESGSDHVADHVSDADADGDSDAGRLVLTKAAERELKKQLKHKVQDVKDTVSTDAVPGRENPKPRGKATGSFFRTELELGICDLGVATTGRSRCGICNEAIQQHSVRFAVHSSATRPPRWIHCDCVAYIDAHLLSSSLEWLKLHQKSQPTTLLAEACQSATVVLHDLHILLA